MRLIKVWTLIKIEAPHLPIQNPSLPNPVMTMKVTFQIVTCLKREGSAKTPKWKTKKSKMKNYLWLSIGKTDPPPYRFKAQFHRHWGNFFRQKNQSPRPSYAQEPLNWVNRRTIWQEWSPFKVKVKSKLVILKLYSHLAKPDNQIIRQQP